MEDETMENIMQIRTPAKTTLQDVVESVVMKGWARVENQFSSAWYAPGTYSKFYLAIYRAIEPYVKSYDICGCFSECTDEIKDAPWLDKGDHIYLLTIPFSLDHFIEQIAFAGLAAIKNLLEPDSITRAFEDLRSAFRGVFSARVYSNPVCKKIGICSLSTETSPWSDQQIHPAVVAKA
jgi:hypothetical protein